eukprot:94381_1
MAQCSYSIAFAIRFKTVDELGFCLACCWFCFILPFGSLVAFCIYLADEDCLDIATNSMFSVSAKDSALTKWIKRKLNKHMGFILEALIEAFPQSLIQISAIVYYQEANVIAILSVLISMASVMSKSLILSQGVEKYTFIWTWLCAVTDFFGIFFTLTWVFYSHDSLSTHLFGYFNIFGMIWLLKTSVSILLPVALGLTVFFLVGYWFVFGLIIHDNLVANSERCKAFGYCLLWLMFGPMCALLYAFCLTLAAEVLCFAIIAFSLFAVSTDRIRSYNTTKVGEIIDFMLRFIANTNKDKHDRMIRILCVNWAAYKCWKCKENSALGKYIHDISDEGQYDALAQVTYRDIREHATSPLKANLPKNIWWSLINDFKSIKAEAYSQSICTWSSFWEWQRLLLYVTLFFIFLPIYVMAKIVQIAYPWIIVVYLIWNDMLFTQQIDGFQLTMLEIYIFLQLVLLFLGVYVLRLHWWLWHICPGVDLYSPKVAQLKGKVHTFYNEMVWFPVTNEIVLRCLGSDIGTIVMDYVKNMRLDLDKF